MEIAQAQQLAQTFAQHDLVSWRAFGLILGGLWTVTTGAAVMIYTRMTAGFAQNGEQHAQLFTLLREQSDAIHESERRIGTSCETRMGSQATRIGVLEQTTSKLKGKCESHQELMEALGQLKRKGGAT